MQLRPDDTDRAVAQLHIAIDALQRQDFSAARFHLQMAHRLARLDERARPDQHDIDVVWTTADKREHSQLVRVRTPALAHAHEVARIEVHLATGVPIERLTSREVGT